MALDVSRYLAWESIIYPDGGTFEGHSEAGLCEGLGNMRYADGDSYTGEYNGGSMSGLGVYKWANGSIYKGEWKARPRCDTPAITLDKLTRAAAQNNNQHGCGKKWYPGGAIEEGEWLDDNFVGDFGACDAAEALATAIDAEQVAQRAREFLYKPDGDVSYKLGLQLEQDPLLYTEGTEFLMPGPLGNLYQVPMNLKVRMMLQLQARKAFDIYRSVNFPRPPADFMENVRNAAFRRTPKVVVDEEDDDDDEPPRIPFPTPPPGVASLSSSVVHTSAAVARAVSQLGRSLRRHKLRREAAK